MFNHGLRVRLPFQIFDGNLNKVGKKGCLEPNHLAGETLCSNWERDKSAERETSVGTSVKGVLVKEKVGFGGRKELKIKDMTLKYNL